VALLLGNVLGASALDLTDRIDPSRRLTSYDG
jgi:hypothetical protein